jgi:hypothetical protein
MSDVNRILTVNEQGDAREADELFPLVYQELRRLAAQKMSQELPSQTFQPTALVHEAEQIFVLISMTWKFARDVVTLKI